MLGILVTLVSLVISDILAMVTLLSFYSLDDLHMLVNLLCLVVMSRNPIADALVWLSYFSPAVELGTLRNIWTSAKSDYDTTSYVLGFSKNVEIAPMSTCLNVIASDSLKLLDCYMMKNKMKIFEDVRPQFTSLSSQHYYELK